MMVGGARGNRAVMRASHPDSVIAMARIILQSLQKTVALSFGIG
jgi:hypothetical protein